MAKRARLVTLHEDSAGIMKPTTGSLGVASNFPAQKVTYFSGGGGLSSTTADYARFLQLFLNGGELDGVRLLGRKTVELMLTNQVASVQGAFGLGFALETPENDFRSVASVGTFSWSGAFNTYYWADPKEKLIGLIYMNTTGGPPIEGPFRTFVYGALK
jgi:CubicO group peptidase (beta-lactamase class C family)